MMQLQVWGGAGEHGRSCYWLRQGDTSILLDCGVKRVGCGEYPLLEPEAVAQLDAVFLSHAHEDHSIAIPWLYKLGFKGKVWTTRHTAEQLPAYYTAWTNYVNKKGGSLPYSEADIAAIEFVYIEDISPTLRWADLTPDLRFCWGRSGHMLGSVWLLFDLGGQRFFYSGDYTEESLLLGTDSPQDVPGGMGALHGAVIDAAYGADPEQQANKLEQLYTASAQILADGGHLLLPVPRSGRGQELLVLMRQRFPAVPLLVEPELLQAMEQLADQPAWLRPGARELIADALLPGSVEVIRDDAQRARLLGADAQPGIFFTTDGMMQSVKAQAYVARLRQRPGSGIVITGHAAEGSYAQELLRMDAAARGCRMDVVRYKIHQGLPDVRRMLQQLTAGAIVLVHAPHNATNQLLAQLVSEGFTGLLSLQPGASIQL